MNSKLILLTLITFFGCSTNKNSYEEFKFEIESTEWNLNPYKFSSFIRDSILTNKGPEFAAWDYSCIGDIKMMHNAWDSQETYSEIFSQKMKDSFALWEKVDAIEFILNEVKSHQVVIINEAHQMPQHRVFTTQLLEGLFKQGFRHIGLETYLAHKTTDSLIHVHGYPNLKTGFYTKEPQFGNLLRVAISQGYNLFGYESEDHIDGYEREINQAKNIKNYIDKYPNEKFIIYCGFDHGYEGEIGNIWQKAMASRLSDLTGFDPLTIDQVKFSERSLKKFENPYYQLFNENNPTVYINNNNKSFGNDRKEAWFDIYVFHPRSVYNQRAEWLKYNDRSEIVFSFDDAPIECPCLVLAYKSGEQIGFAIPYDVQEVKTKKAHLILDKSEYDIVIWNNKGKALKTKYSIMN